MLQLIAKVLRSSGTSLESHTEGNLNFIKSKKAILKELTESKETGRLIGVYARALGEGMFLTGVSNIESESGREVIVFETYDMSGSILNRTRLALDEIKMVFPFTQPYINPILGKIPAVISQHRQ